MNFSSFMDGCFNGFFGNPIPAFIVFVISTILYYGLSYLTVYVAQNYEKYSIWQYYLYLGLIGIPAYTFGGMSYINCNALSLWVLSFGKHLFGIG